MRIIDDQNNRTVFKSTDAIKLIDNMLKAQFSIIYLKDGYVVNNFPLHRYNKESKAYEEGEDYISKIDCNSVSLIIYFIF